MRRRIGATAVAVAALLTLTGIAGAGAHAATSADDIFYPADGSGGASGDAGNGADKGDKGGSDDVTAAGAGAAAAADREAALARGDRQAANMMGYLPSLYQGKWFMPGKEDVRRCIMDRESNFNYRANGSGLYFGAYQMSAALARGATYMMQTEVAKEMGDEGVALVKALRQAPPNTWNRYWQDRAFWTIWRGGEGAGHWRGGAFNCH